MKRLASLLLLSGCSCHAAAQAPLPDDERGAYLSTQFGNGRIDGDGAIGFRQMRWRAFEARVGRALNPALVGEDALDSARSGARIDFVYYNEGHPDNNHRDGFAFQLAYARKLGDWVTAEMAAGPYTSMNTTVIDGVQYDSARRGILYSAALRFPLAGFDPGTHVRLGFNHVWMRDTFQSNAIMLGVGRDITDAPPFSETERARGRLWLGASYGRSNTNQSGTQAANGAIFEAKQYGGKWAMSVKALFEGDDRSRVDRRGVAAQFWFVQPLTERWAASAGVGPYIAQNRREGNRTGTHGLITLQFERNLGERTKVFFAFYRVKTFTEMNDRDLFHLGMQHVFAGG
ncbi:MAG: outer membrane beta-barrel protein [Massilia sp.]